MRIIHKLPYMRFVMLACVLLFMSNDIAIAQTQGAPPPGICTSDPTFNIPNNMTIVTSIVNNITCLLYGPGSAANCSAGGSVASNMFNNIVGNNTFFTIIAGAGALMIIMYALAFTLGLVELNFVDFTIRLFKLSLIVVLISPGSWNFFYNSVGVFFQQGTNWLIGITARVALGVIPGLNPLQPFQIIDLGLATAFSSKMFITVVAMLLTGPYGWLYAILAFLGLGSFVAALFQAVWIYLMSMIVRAFLFGLAPIFIPFLFFKKTRHLFDGWLSQLVNTMLQPALLFSFFAFFTVLVQTSMYNLLRVPVCFMPGSSIFPGSPQDEVLPRFTLGGEPYGRGWNFLGPVEFPGFGPFPLNIMDVLMFVLLTHLAWRFNGIAINIAKEISGSPTSYNVPGAFSTMLNSKQAMANSLTGTQFQSIRDTAEGQQAMVAAQGAAANNPAGIAPKVGTGANAPGAIPPQQR